MNGFGIKLPSRVDMPLNVRRKIGLRQNSLDELVSPNVYKYIYCHQYINIYILSFTDRMFRCITTLLWG